MAARKKKTEGADSSSQRDPKAPVDGAALLKRAVPLLKLLSADLLERTDHAPAVTAALKARHGKEKAEQRTAESYDAWRRNFVEQVAAAWFLSCVFVRALEDRGLLERNRLAGPGALDSERAFFALAPSLNQRDYLLTVFRELCHLPAAEALFDPRYNPVWLLGPSATAAQQLLELFRSPDADGPAFRFGGSDTHFLGELYQDVSEDVRKRYALLQTPPFVERFILDRTLTPAIERFGLDEASLIDPTCGSGHFLLGAFDRLFDARLKAEPGVDVRQAAHKALDAVAGADINPYAVAIAKFRLTLVFVEKGGYRRLKEVPRLPLHVVVADSLLHNPHGKQQELGDVKGASIAAWKGSEFQLEDEVGAREVLYRTYAAVVGNPPYITVKDAALRERYRRMYERSAGGKYSLAAPFCERFFQLGRQRAHVGMITANSFMKREFGKKLIQDYLPSVNLETIINTSGAYIPGHVTPTVLLFGTTEPPRRDDVLMVLASRGEPSTPGDPERGHVWSNIVGHWREEGFQNEYISVVRSAREALRKHPWSLAGGGALELKDLLEENADKKLGSLATAIGFDAIMGEDDIFFGPKGWLKRLGTPDDHVRGLGVGENVRDWSIQAPDDVLFPYGSDLNPLMPKSHRVAAYLWRYRTTLVNRHQFGKTTLEAGLEWFEYRSFYKSKRNTPLSITFAFVATHNHFALDRGGKVFSRTAPIIKLPESATEDDHYALLAYLNSSTACFWMKQVFYPKASAVGDISTEKGKPEANRYEFTGTGLQALPLPKWSDAERQSAIELAREATMLAAEIETLGPAAIAKGLRSVKAQAAESMIAQTSSRLRAVQEDLDWLAYKGFGLVHDWVATKGTATGLRPFETADSSCLPQEWENRFCQTRISRELQLVEDLLYKRPWMGRQGVFGHAASTRDEQITDTIQEHIQLAIENALAGGEAPQTASTLRRALTGSKELDKTSLLLGVRNLPDRIELVMDRLDHVPFLAVARFTETGLDTFRIWEQTWALQRKEDAGERLHDIPVPPKYAQNDFRDQRYWSLRGKLDVPKERFISYPGCESDEDGEPLYGWAGWDHYQRAKALAELYYRRKNEDGWAKERLQPMLAGLLELLPWLMQWHNEPLAELAGGKPSEQFAQLLEAECAEHGFTHDDLRAWRPPERKRSKAKA